MNGAQHDGLRLWFLDSTIRAILQIPVRPWKLIGSKEKSKGKGKLEQKGKGKNESDGKGKGKGEKGKTGTTMERARTSGIVAKAMDGLPLQLMNIPAKGKARARTKESRSQTRLSAIGVESLAIRPGIAECAWLVKVLEMQLELLHSPVQIQPQRMELHQPHSM